MRFVWLLAAMLAFGIAVFGASGSSSAQEARLRAGELPTGGGIALAVWAGGPVEELAVEASNGGCNIASVWTNQPSGGLIGYISGALTVVNNDFNALFAGGVLAANTPVILVCRPGGTVTLPDPETEPDTTTLPSNIIIDVEEGVGAQDLELIRSGIKAVDDYMRANFGRSVDEDTLVQVVVDMPQSTCCFAVNGNAVIAVGHEVWVDTARFREIVGFELREEIAAHEFVHLQQFEVGCISSFRQPEFLWLSEGTAEWVGFHAVFDQAAIALEVMPYMEASTVFGDDQPSSLAERERSQPLTANYSNYYLAVERLVQRSSPAALGTFCERVAAGIEWRTAFTQAFGIAPAAFYAEFEVYKAGLNP